MLIKNVVLDDIKAGRISLIFRRWKKAGARAVTRSGPMEGASTREELDALMGDMERIAQ